MLVYTRTYKIRDLPCLVVAWHTQELFEFHATGTYLIVRLSKIIFLSKMDKHENDKIAQ